MVLSNPHLLLALTSVFWAAHWIVAPELIRNLPAYWRARWPILFFGTCGTMLYNCIGYMGIRDTTATNAVLFQSVTPGFIPLFAWLLFRERIRALTAVGLAISF